MAARSSGPDLRGPDRGDRWDRDRFFHEQDRDSRDRGGRFDDDRRSRFEEDESYHRRGPVPQREASERPRRRFVDEDDVVLRERSEVNYDGPEFLRRRPSPPGSEIDRRIFYKRETERVRSPSPPRPRRPGQMVRRQSSLDTFDRKPTRFHEREYSPPRRGGDYRVPPYQPIPLPRSKALPPPRVYAERDFYEEIEVSDPHRHGDDDFHGPPEKVQERVHEKETVHTRRRRSVSRSSRAHHHSHSRSRRSRSRSSSSSSSSGGTSLTATTRTTRTTSEYPKKGKTRIPSRLVSKRALIDLGYPFVEEGNVVIVQKALGQQNIDDLLKLSEDYKKSELEIMAARSSAGDVFEERIVEERHTEYVNVAPPHDHVDYVQQQTHPSGALVVTASPPAPPPPPSPTVQFARTAMVRDVSPARSYTTTSYESTTTGTSSTVTGPVVIDAYPKQQTHYHQALVPAGGHEIVLPRRRSRSRHHRHGSRDLIRAERLSTGELVLYEEEVEHVEPTRDGVRVQKDKRGRMSISVPRNR
ncbi:hypothetical protein QBC39DRAFT_257602 [Podospora conica]|nr:hypothetical protein QBC39DRAFT_257602 [Schizothecium conicum]